MESPKGQIFSFRSLLGSAKCPCVGMAGVDGKTTVTCLTVDGGSWWYRKGFYKLYMNINLKIYIFKYNIYIYQIPLQILYLYIHRNLYIYIDILDSVYIYFRYCIFKYIHINICNFSNRCNSGPKPAILSTSV